MTHQPIRRLLLSALGIVLALSAVACGSRSDPATSAREAVDVSGDFATKPTIDIDSPMKVGKTSSWVLRQGDGDKVTAQATTILHLTLADGRTGKTAISTFDQGSRPLEVTLGEQVFPSLVTALTGKRAGSRVVVASSSRDAYGERGAPQIGIKAGDPVVMVADIVSTDPTSVLDGPEGDDAAPPRGMPQVREAKGVPSGFVWGKAAKPRKLVTYQLRKGAGPQVRSPSRVTVNYLGTVWAGKKPFDESYSKEPTSFSVGLGSVIKCWDQGLEGVREGARVVLVCPPALAYGKSPQPNIPGRSTLVFVVDVLGVG